MAGKSETKCNSVDATPVSHNELAQKEDNENRKSSVDEAETADENVAVEIPSNDGEVEANAPKKKVKLYKSIRLKGYITIALASFINYDSAIKSEAVLGSGSVPSLPDQRRYAMSVSIISLTISCFSIVAHWDRFTPLQKLWIAAFQPGSKVEMVFAGFLVVWWSVAVGVTTSVAGIAGDGKGQYSMYVSAWVCCLTSIWILERWCVSAGLSSFKSFISSWPNRSPAWITIALLSLVTMIWYIDLRHNSKKLDRTEDIFNWNSESFKFFPMPTLFLDYFNSIGEGQWQWLLIATSFTLIPAVLFVLAEIFRDSNSDGTVQAKSKGENIIEGICFLGIILIWIPTVIVATTPGGAASLPGNAYFFTWLLVIFVFEGAFWFIHDIRKKQHQALRRKQAEYKRRQQKVLDQTRKIQNQHLNDWDDRGMMEDPETQQQQNRRNRSNSDLFDGTDG